LNQRRYFSILAEGYNFVFWPSLQGQLLDRINGNEAFLCATHFYYFEVKYAMKRYKATTENISVRISVSYDEPQNYLHVRMVLVWDSRIVCDKTVHAFNRYALRNGTVRRAVSAMDLSTINQLIRRGPCDGSVFYVLFKKILGLGLR